MTLDTAHAEHITMLRSLPATIDREGLRIGEQYVMFFAEAELMRLHAERLVAGKASPDVLEIGLGLGIFAEQLTTCGIGSYTAVEPHREVAHLAHERVLRSYPVPMRVFTEPWQLITVPDDSMDAIMYDTWPPDGHADLDFDFFVEQVAVRCLRPGGRFSFFHSGPTLSQTRCAVLDRHFEEWATTPYELSAARVPAHWTKPTRDFLIPVAMKGGSQ